MILVIDKEKVCELRLANNSLLRIKGLMFTKNVNYAMLFNKCNWIHTFFMRDKIDVIYLSKNEKILKIQEHIKPWRICKPVRKAYYTLELPNNTVKNFSINFDSQIEYI